MANTHTSLSALFTDIANAIREKTGETGTIVADDFPDLIRRKLQIKPRECLTFSSTNPFSISVGTKKWDGKIEYSRNKIDWVVWDGTPISTANSDKNVIYLTGTGNTKIIGSNNQNYAWKIDGTNVQCDGNIETLLDYDTVERGKHPNMSGGCYMWMFYNCTALTKAPSLPAISLPSNSYLGMFCNCTALTEAPSLPATTIGTNCYNQMFRSCTSLKQIPSLPNKTMQNYCYKQMFYGCTGIKISDIQGGEYTQAYCIPPTGDGVDAYGVFSDMFYGTGGTFTGTPSINTTYYLSNTNEIV